MKIVIAGGSGFIGRKLTDFLINKGHKVVILTRKHQQALGNVSYVEWLEKGTKPEKELGYVDVVINLAGVSINRGRWTAKHKKEIYESRMTATEELIRIIETMSEKPSVLINASAIGIYPASQNNVYTEDSSEAAKDFLGLTVYDWEKKAKQVEGLGIRAIFMRFGVVLGNDGGALPLITFPYKFFVGGTIGSGAQWVSWVHVMDVVRAIDFVMEKSELHGPVNVTAPLPIKMKDFGKEIGSVLHRPHWLSVPSFILKWVLGEKSTLVLEGQYVVPNVLKKEGFEFMYPSLTMALKNLLKN